METAETNRIRSRVVEQFGYYCTFCGSRKCKLKMDRINRARPEAVTNVLLVCEVCAEHERPGLFDRGEYDGRRR